MKATALTPNQTPPRVSIAWYCVGQEHGKSPASPWGREMRPCEHPLMTQPQEYMAVVEKKFKATDPDNDGTVDHKELDSPAGQALLKLPRAHDGCACGWRHYFLASSIPPSKNGVGLDC